MSTKTWKTKLRRLLPIVAIPALLLGGAVTFSVTTAGMAHADTTHQAVIGMPFSGKWAYNVIVHPDANGNYSDTTSSHPSVHAKYYGNWATDAYAAPGTAVKFEVPYATGNLSYSWVSDTNGSCGQRTKVEVKVDGVSVGVVYYEHLASAVNSGPITNGMVVGYVHDWGGCNPGPHVHIELKNTTNYACWVDHGYPGTSLSQGDDFGVLGSTNTGERQKCSSIPSGSSSGGGTTTYPDGTFLRGSSSKTVYIMAGGAPMAMTTWSYWGGAQPTTVVPQSTMDALVGSHPYPKDGTFIKKGGTKAILEVIGGSYVDVSSWSTWGGTQPYTTVDPWAIQNQLLQTPRDGTFVKDGTSRSILEIVGDAPLPVSSWSNVGGTQPYVAVDPWAVDNDLRQYPLDGTYVNVVGDGVYVIAGGAALDVRAWANVGGVRPATHIDVWDIANYFRSYPVDGTLVQGYGSGREYLVQNQAAVYQNPPTGSPTIVDDWAIINQLGATEQGNG